MALPSDNVPTARRIDTRIIGYDVARALAVLGMVIVNFEVVMSAGQSGSKWLIWLVGLIEGRAAATFVVLAGIGLSLMSRRARKSNDTIGLRRIRITLLKRALFLFVVGLAYTPIWPADILHFYGLYIAGGVMFLAASQRMLWLATGSIIAIFPILLFLFNYESGWNWETLEYSGFWSASGMVRHLLFNGFHPVFPWTAFLIVGLLIGRRDLSARHVRQRILIYAILTLVIAEAASWSLTNWITPSEILDANTITTVFGTSPMPPTPLYMLSAGGTAVAVIYICLTWTANFPQSLLVKLLVRTGQMALTLYVAHVVVGMGTLETFGLLKNQTLLMAVGCAAAFYLLATIFAYYWLKRFDRGPLETAMRWLT